MISTSLKAFNSFQFSLKVHFVYYYMFLVLTLRVFSVLIVLLLKAISSLIVEYSLLNREELTSYECGFEHHNLSRVPFSLRYFFLTLIFLLFDLEIILILFFPYSMFFSLSFFSLFAVMFFIVFLFIGLLYEWKDGRLEWIM